MSNVSDKNRTRLVGQAGVMQVASQLLVRGVNVSFPAVDVGYDLLSEAGLRIQVKATSLKMNGPWRCKTAYYFHLRRCARAQGNNKIRPTQVRIFSQECDFVVLWGITENRFFVVPAEYLDGASLACVLSAVSIEKADAEVILQDLQSGLTRKQVAEKHGLARQTIDRKANGEYKPGKFISQKVRECESRWDFITSHSTLLEQAEAAAELQPETQPLEVDDGKQS